MNCHPRTDLVVSSVVERSHSGDPDKFKLDYPNKSGNDAAELYLRSRPQDRVRGFGARDDMPKFDPLKKFFKIYINNFPGASELRAKLMETKSTDEAREVLGAVFANEVTQSRDKEDERYIMKDERKVAKSHSGLLRRTSSPRNDKRTK